MSSNRPSVQFRNRWICVCTGLLLAACGSEPAVGLPEEAPKPVASQKEVVPAILHDSTAKPPNQVDLEETVSQETLMEKVPAFAALTPIDQKTLTTTANTVEAPCEPCQGRTLASCFVEMPAGCENLHELRDRTVQMVNSGAAPAAIRSALIYTDAWIPHTVPTDRPFDGQAGGMPMEVWVDPASSSVRPVVATLDDLDLRGVQVYFRIVPMEDTTASRAWSAAAIAAESQGLLEAFLRGVIQWRDEQRTVQGSLQLEVTGDDLDVIVTALDGEGFDRARFEQERTSAAVTARIEADRKLADTVGVRVAPSWFVDGYRLRGAQSDHAIQRVIDLERLSYLGATPDGTGAK